MTSRYPSGSKQPATRYDDHERQNQLARKSLDGHPVHSGEALSRAAAMSPGPVYVAEHTSRQHLVQKRRQVVLPHRCSIGQGQPEPFDGVTPSPGRQRHLKDRKCQCGNQDKGRKAGKLLPELTRINRADHESDNQNRE